MKTIILCLMVIWIYLLSVFNRGELFFFKFIFGCVGMFFFGLYFIEPYAMVPLSKAVAVIAGIIGEIMGLFEAYADYSIIFINKNNAYISFYIDYECSGIIEIMAYLSLLTFFRVYNTAEKIIVGIGGFAWIFASNVIRIICICAIIYIFGNDSFYFAHVIFGRLIFYLLSVTLYFYTFTKAHIIRQKVGQFSYGNNNNKNN